MLVVTHFHYLGRYSYTIKSTEGCINPHIPTVQPFNSYYAIRRWNNRSTHPLNRRPGDNDNENGPCRVDTHTITHSLNTHTITHSPNTHTNTHVQVTTTTTTHPVNVLAISQIRIRLVDTHTNTHTLDTHTNTHS